MSDVVNDETSLDTPIDRATIDRLPVDVLDRWLSTLRDRRLVVVRKLESARAAKRQAYISDVEERYKKMYDRVSNNLKKLEETIGKVEEYLNKLRAIELELSDDGEEDGDAEQGNTADDPIQTV